MPESVSVPPSRPCSRSFSDSFVFVGEALRGFRATGAIMPSGRRLAAELAAPLRERRGPLRVLEAGAGTGAVTRALLPLLSPGATLDVVEFNERFAAGLRELTAGRAGVSVHCLPVEEFAAAPERAGRYDVIVSGLPFTNFPPPQVSAIMDGYLRLLRPDGSFTCFTYAGTRRLRSLVASRAEAARHREVEAVLAGYWRRYGARSRPVWANVPPALVWRLR